MFGLILQVTVILAAALFAQAALRRSSAAIRHFVLLLALAGILVLPFAAVIARSLPVAPVQLPLTFSARAGAAPSLPASTVPWLALAWLAGSALFAMRAIAAMMATSRTAGRSMTGDAGFRTSEEAIVPFVWGLRQPVIVLPAASAAWPSDRLRAIVMHERAHIERHDCWAILLAEIARAAYWFHPLVWVVAGQLRREQEQACDDAVLRSGIEAPEYAGHLLESARCLRAAALAPCAVQRSGLESRFSSILHRTRSREALTRSQAIIAMIALAGIMLPVAAMQDTRGGEKKKIYRAKDGIIPPKLLSKQEPGYTEEARDAKIQGTVTLDAEISSAGEPGNIRVIKGLDPGLDRNAVEAVRLWKFEPGRLNGEPVTVAATIEIQFALK